MAKLRRDPINGRWIIVNVEEPSKPDDFEKEQHIYKGDNCPFCYGHENLTPPEVDAFRKPGAQPNTPGWQVRVVPNKYPALENSGNLDRRAVGIFDMSNGIGDHEVIIDSPNHKATLDELNDHEVEAVVRMYCRRATTLIEDKRFKYILIFKNHGPSAGASLEHEHSQLIALPMVPKNVLDELHGSHHYYNFRGRCVFCDIIFQENQEKERIILENEDFISFCPYISRFPFEIWVMPKKHSPYFCHMEDREKANLSKILKQTLSRLKKILYDPAYNFIIHTSPIDETNKESYHWHIEIMPKLTRVAGFEWGTGFYIVPTPPEVAAKYLREVK
ncbi:MAG: galactose-1-phosphate uridylyltransferase [Candidatus Omnitrophica bacterium]|nr:galactose-1-phosphate uridylyltransferase [Candidatus Omnitrophota bacterium]